MRRFVLLAALVLPVLFVGCERSVPSHGLNLGTYFPQRADWYWKFNSDDFVEVSVWHSLGTTAPAGMDWITFRVWVDEEQNIIDDIADGEASDWELQLYWSEEPDGWYLRGWEANPDGPSPDLGSELFEEVGVPFAVANVTTGDTWTVDANGRTWTVTATEVQEDLEFNSQVLLDVWRVDVSSDTGDTPVEGSWWLSGGPGLVQWDLPPWRADEPTGPWQHVHNDTYDNILGVDVR